MFNSIIKLYLCHFLKMFVYIKIQGVSLRRNRELVILTAEFVSTIMVIF